MPARVYMVPSPGVRVLHPAGAHRQGRPLAAVGEWVTLTDYWTRRELDGSIVRGHDPTEAPAPVVGKGKTE